MAGSVRHRALARLAMLALGAGLVPLVATPASACSCGPVTDGDALNSADAVFTGTVESISEPRSTVPGTMQSSDPVRVIIAVDEVIKGDVPDRTPVITASDGGACGAQFVEGEAFAVFASYGGSALVEADADDLTANLCDGTRPLAGAPLEIDGAAVVPVASSNPLADEGFPLLGWLSYVAVAGLALMTIGLWASFARRR